MPTRVHEFFLARVVEEIQSRLRNVEGAEGPSMTFARKIQHGGSETIINRSPDAIFQHSDASWPGVVLEISYSQKTKDLKDLADDYILQTRGNVRVVVGLDINYTTKEGTISMWRPEYVYNEQGHLGLRAAQTLDGQVCTSLVFLRVALTTSRCFEMSSKTLTSLRVQD